MAEGDIEQNVIVQVAGADQAAAQLRTLESAFAASSKSTQVMGRAATEMGDRTASAFQHAGIYLFSRQLLDMVNMGALAQHAFLAISLGFESITDAVGLTAAAVAPFLLVIAGAMLIYERWEKHIGKVSKAMEKETAAQEKLAKSYETTLKQLKDYSAAIGSLPGELQGLQSATESAFRAVEAARAHNLGVQLAAAEQQQLSDKSTSQALRDKLANDQQELLAAGGAEEAFWKKQVQTTTDALKATELRMTENAAAIAKYKADIKSIGEGFTDTGDRIKNVIEGHKKVAEAAKKSAAEQKRASDEFGRWYEKELDKETKAADKAYSEEWKKYDEAQAKKLSAAQQSLASESRIFTQTMGHLESLTSSAFAKIIVEHTKWKDAFKNIAKQVEEAFVSAVIRMMEQWMMFEALTGVAGMFGLGGAAGAAGWANTVGGTHFGGAGASGLDATVNSPTLFMAGEGGGPERIQVTPQGPNAAAGGGMGGSTVINATINVSGSGDPRAVAQEIMRQVRGLAQLDFVRAH